MWLPGVHNSTQRPHTCPVTLCPHPCLLPPDHMPCMMYRYKAFHSTPLLVRDTLSLAQGNHLLHRATHCCMHDGLVIPRRLPQSVQYTRPTGPFWQAAIGTPNAASACRSKHNVNMAKEEACAWWRQTAAPKGGYDPGYTWEAAWPLFDTHSAWKGLASLLRARLCPLKKTKSGRSAGCACTCQQQPAAWPAGPMLPGCCSPAAPPKTPCLLLIQGPAAAPWAYTRHTSPAMPTYPVTSRAITT